MLKIQKNNIFIINIKTNKIQLYQKQINQSHKHTKQFHLLWRNFYSPVTF